MARLSRKNIPLRPEWTLIVFAGKFAVSGGVQYGFNGMVFARVGYRASGSDVIASGVSAGLGCKFHGVRVDFAYQRASSLNILAFSLGYSF